MVEHSSKFHASEEKATTITTMYRKKEFGCKLILVAYIKVALHRLVSTSVGDTG